MREPINKGFVGNIEKLTTTNKNFRQVISTTTNMQVVLMCLQPNEEIGLETHPHTTQFFRIESGMGIAIIGDKKFVICDDDAVVVPPNTPHNIINTSTENVLQLYTIYTPPEHQLVCVQSSKQSKEC